MEQDLKKQLFERLDNRLAWNAVLLGKRASEPSVDDVYALGELIERHRYLKEEHDFAPGEVDALLCFFDPLEVAQCCWAENGFTHFPICEILEDINAYKRFPLTNEEQERRNKPQVKQLMERLDQNFAAYNASLLGKSKQELVDSSLEIATTQAAYEYMRQDFQYAYGETELLLQLDNPLRYLASRWSLDFDLTGDDDDTIADIISDLDDPDNLRDAQKRFAAVQKEKTSVREQLRNTAQEAGQRPPTERKPHRDEAR